MTNITDKTASKFLGKKTDGAETYNPDLPVAVPRAENRLRYGINPEKLPFEGVDVWHAYEFSALTRYGMPVTRVLKLRYSCESDFIVESKSLKLYLNSFNMSKFGDTAENCLAECKKLIENDLGNTLKTTLTAEFLDNDAERVNIFSEFLNIMDFVDENSVKIEYFKEAPELLQTEENGEVKSYYL